MTKEELREKYIKLYEENEEDLKDHVERYGEKICDYLLIRRYRQQYYLGALAALHELD